MEDKKVYTFEELSSMNPHEAGRIIREIQEENLQLANALNDTTTRFSDQIRKMDTEIDRLKIENEALTAQMEILKAALGDRNSVIRVRNSEHYGRSTEKLSVMLAGLLSGMDDHEKKEVMDKLTGFLTGTSLQQCQDEGSTDTAGSSADGKDTASADENTDTEKKSPAWADSDTGANDPEAGKRGNLSISRIPGFISRYFKEGTAVVFKIDDFTYTADEVRERFGLESIDEVAYLCSDIEVYETADVIPAIALHTYHITLKLKRNIDDVNRTLWNQRNGRLFNGASICSPSLLSYIVTQKIANGTTYYRVETMLSNMGLNIKRPTFIGWMERAAAMLAALPRYMMRLLKKHSVIQVDETFDTVTHDERGAGKASYFWMFRPSEYSRNSRPVVLYWFDPSRSAIIPEYYLYDYDGMVMSDGYIAYKTLTKRNGDIVRCVCWVHGRRFIVKSFIGSDMEFNARMAKENGPKSLENLDIYHLDEVDEEQKISLWGWIALLMIAEMFRIEKTAKDMGPEERLSVRNKEMKLLVDEFFRLVSLVKDRPQALANSYAKEAISYFDNNREALGRIFEDGMIPLSNNAAERAAISLALGRNAWKAHDTDEGARTTALFYSLVETAKANGANPCMYIRFVLESIQDIWHQYQAVLLESDRFEKKKLRRLEAARKRLKKHPGKDPELDMTGLGEEPDLSFLECLMPWSAEFAAYCASQTENVARMLAGAITRDGLDKMPVSGKGFCRIINGKNGDEKTAMVREALKDAAKDREPASIGEGQKSSPAKDIVLPEKRRPYAFCAGDGGVSPVNKASGAGRQTDAGGHVPADAVPLQEDNRAWECTTACQKGGPPPPLIRAGA